MNTTDVRETAFPPQSPGSAEYSASRSLLEVLYDIRSPLQSIYNTLVLLQQDPSLSDENRYRVEKSLEQMERVVVLLKESHVRPKDKTPSEVARVDLVALIKNARFHLAYMEAMYPNVRWVEVYPAEGAWLKGYVGELERLFSNLMINAYEAIRRDPGEIRVRVSCHPQGRIEISFDNTGSVSVDRQTSNQMMRWGTGTALNACKEIVKAHHGSMQVLSRPKVGTSITIGFPGFETS